ncbi:MAG: hypothetical protein QM763_05715 [Agriterribacter sp.]
MEVITTKTFAKSLKSLPAKSQSAVMEVVLKLDVAVSLEVSGVDYKKLEGQRKGERYYRIRVGERRIGCEYINPKIILITVLSRSTIYKKFP